MDAFLMGMLAIIALLVVGLIRFVWKTYNELIYFRIQVDKQASHVDVHLKQKFDMIPALLDVVKGYAKHEKGTMEEVTKLRSQWGAAKTPEQKMKTANMLESALSKLLLVQERYPNLKANKSFLSIQKSIRVVEQQLVHERKVFNQRVKRYNVRLQLFPRVIVAKMFGFGEKTFFQMEK